MWEQSGNMIERKHIIKRSNTIGKKHMFMASRQNK